MAPKKKAPADAPRGKRTSAAAFSALALLSGLLPGRAKQPDTSSAPSTKKPSSAPSPAATKKAAPKKRAVPAKPPPAPSETVSGRPKPTLQRERPDRVSEEVLASTPRRRRRRARPGTSLDPPPQPPPPKKTPQPAVGEAVRVWWPPTRDPAKTGFSGAYWPARVVPGPTGGIPGADWATVRYDNGERGRALLDDLFPANPPVAFGGERDAIKPGEFVEVHNGSSTDPCAWFGVARKVLSSGGGSAVVSYPFHDSDDEAVPLARVRRARVWEGGAWQIPRPGQRWAPGDVTSPRELELLGEREYKAWHLSSSGGGGNGGGAAAKRKAPPPPPPKEKKAAEVVAAAKAKKPAVKASVKAKPKAKAVALPPKAKKAAAPGKRPVGRPPKK